MSVSDPYRAPKPEFIRNAFNSISPNYDTLNHILSFGQADRWRKRACAILLGGGQAPFSQGQAPFPQEKVPVPFLENGASPQNKGTGTPSGSQSPSVLDLGVGTADSLKWFLRAKKWRVAAGLDFAFEMLLRGKKKVPEAAFLSGDFHKLPLRDGSFDAVFSAFTLRSVQDMPGFFAETKRVLKFGGRVGFLELTRPRNFLRKLFFFPYLRIFLPLMGWLVSGNGEAYRFLSQSVEKFQTPEQTLEAMRQTGFRDLRTKSFSFGAATLIIGQK